MALRATVAVEGWSQAFSVFAWDGCGDGIDLLETRFRLTKECLLVAIQG
jgi:hypothetical protein